MRLLGCSALLLTALSTANGQAREQRIKEYIAARAVYQRTFDSLWKVSPGEARVIDPPRMAGLTDTGTIKIGSMAGAYENEALPDAIVYQTVDGVDVIVSDTSGRRVPIAQERIRDSRLPGQPRNDFEKLQGRWRIADARARMSNEPAMIIDGLVDRGTIEFTGNTVTMRQLPHVDLASFTFTLDTLVSPRRLRMIDATAADSARWTGIYRITGDTLRLSLPISHSSNNPVPPAGFNAPNTAAYILRRDPP
jgi:uncharacterized protein (TIGR03067 family)